MLCLPRKQGPYCLMFKQWTPGLKEDTDPASPLGKSSERGASPRCWPLTRLFSVQQLESWWEKRCRRLKPLPLATNTTVTFSNTQAEPLWAEQRFKNIMSDIPSLQKSKFHDCKSCHRRWSPRVEHLKEVQLRSPVHLAAGHTTAWGDLASELGHWVTCSPVFWPLSKLD